MVDYDRSYRRLFSHPQVVADLLTGFVREPWTGELALETLEPYPARFVDERMRVREADTVWRVRCRGQWLYIYILIEFQSRVDRHMALRLLVYVGMLYQHLLRAGELGEGEPLPPVLPIVLYNGRQPWHAPLDVAELVLAVPQGLDRYVPRMQYLLIDEQRYPAEELSRMRNLVAAIMRLEQSRTPDDIHTVLDNLDEWLSGESESLSELQRTIVEWILTVVYADRRPGPEFRKVQGLREADAMITEQIREWERNAKKEGLEEGFKKGMQEGIRQGIQQGIQQGIEEGVRQGRKAGEAELLMRLLQRKFGTVSEQVRHKIEEADDQQLLEWGEKLVDAERIEDVFE